MIRFTIDIEEINNGLSVKTAGRPFPEGSTPSGRESIYGKTLAVVLDAVTKKLVSRVFPDASDPIVDTPLTIVEKRVK